MLPRNRNALAELLARTFPSSANQLDGETIDAFIDALMAAKARRGELRPRTPSSPASSEQVVFRLRATHARRLPIVSVFTGTTEAVRVVLGVEAPITWDTPIGLVIPEDHLLPTVAALRAKFGDRIARPFEHVELITPARHAFTRFAPMAIYLGYAKAGDPQPFFYVFEAGTATGQPKALYLAPTLDATVEERSGYVPTPLSSADHWYTGGLRFAANGTDPEVLYMRASKERGGEPHLRLHVDYEIVEGHGTTIPAEDMVEAAMRMLAVQRGLSPALNLAETLIGEAGLGLLDWVDRPDASLKDREHSATRVAHTRDATSYVAALHDYASTLPELERALLHASPAALLGLVARADGKFDRLERIEVDWVMNFEVPAQLGEAFRFSHAAERAYEDLMAADPGPARSDETWLPALGELVEAMPSELRRHYREFIAAVCKQTAESSGERLWFGSKVSEREQVMLDRIDAALGL